MPWAKSRNERTEPMIPLDYHVHSTFSPDASASPEALCVRAVEMGLPEIGFAEHWDVGPYESVTCYADPQKWGQEIQRLRMRFAGRLTIRLGVELAEPHLYPQETAEILSHMPFDYAIGSVHWVGSRFMFDEQALASTSADELYQSYFDVLEKLVCEADIDIVGHFDIPARNAKPMLGYDPSRYEESIRKILAQVIERGLSLDVNTAGLRKPAQNLMPDLLILQWYHEMGGERVTLGSDAHAVEQLGLHLDEAIRAIKTAGIQQVTRYERRKPRLIPLD